MSHKDEFAYILERAKVPDAAAYVSPPVIERLKQVRHGLVKKGFVTLAAGVFMLAGVTAAQAQIDPYTGQNIYNNLSNPYTTPQNKEVFALTQGWQLISNSIQQAKQRQQQALYGPNATDLALDAKEKQIQEMERAADLQVREREAIARLNSVNGVSVPQPTQYREPQATQYRAPSPQNSIPDVDGQAISRVVVHRLVTDPSLAYSSDHVGRASVYQDGVVVMPDHRGVKTLFTLDVQNEILQMPVDPNVSLRKQLQEMTVLRVMNQGERSQYAQQILQERQLADANVHPDTTPIAPPQTRPYVPPETYRPADAPVNAQVQPATLPPLNMDGPSI